MIKPSELTEVEIITKVAAKIKDTKHSSRKVFTLTFAQCKKLFRSTEVCFYTGQPFEDFSDITFERIDPTLGYINGNVVLVKSAINDFKGKNLDPFFFNNQMDGEEVGKLLMRLGKAVSKRAKARKAAEAENQKKIQSRLSSLAQQTQLMKESKQHDQVKD